MCPFKGVCLKLSTYPRLLCPTGKSCANRVYKYRMNTIIINATNLKLGGGIQVADSICCELYKYSDIRFIVLLSSYLDATAKKIEQFPNVKVIRYNIKNSFKTLVFGRDSFLDKIVKVNRVNAVITVFGPSRWNPQNVPHLSGFAMAHIVLRKSPYFKQLKGFNKLKSIFKNTILDMYFRRSTTNFYTENPYISKLLAEKWPMAHVSTITNNYNQVFDTPEKWERVVLPPFPGVSLLCISANYPHKNLAISKDVSYYLKEHYPEFKFRFVFTVTSADFPIPIDLTDNFILLGKVDIAQCPSLYEQCDIVFQPSLLECFTATYAESMKMGKPIVTTDIEFARGLCGEAALYYSPLLAKEAAEYIMKLVTNSTLKNKLVEAGKKQLQKFDTAEIRCEKIIELTKSLINN